jgi:hypothetical protein
VSLTSHPAGIRSSWNTFDRYNFTTSQSDLGDILDRDIYDWFSLLGEVGARVLFVRRENGDGSIAIIIEWRIK